MSDHIEASPANVQQIKTDKEKAAELETQIRTRAINKARQEFTNDWKNLMRKYRELGHHGNSSYYAGLQFEKDIQTWFNSGTRGIGDMAVRNFIDKVENASAQLDEIRHTVENFDHG